MASMLTRAIHEAGFSDTERRLLAGEALAADELERLRAADLLLVAGLADQVRRRFRGDAVRVIEAGTAREPRLCVFAAEAARTGAELLREIALTRLQLPGEQALAVSLDELGTELAETALVFGADVLLGAARRPNSLPLADAKASQAARAELARVIEQHGRSVVFQAAGTGADREQRS